MDDRFARFFTTEFEARLRRWLAAHVGNSADLADMVDEIRQEVVQKILREIGSAQNDIDFSDRYFLVRARSALQDHYRRIYGHIRAPARLITETGDERLANDVFSLFCLQSEVPENVVRKIERLVQSGERDYPFDSGRVEASIRFIKDNGLCKPTRVQVGIRDPDDSYDQQDARTSSVTPSSQEPGPESLIESHQVYDLLREIIGKTRHGDSVEALRQRFLDDDVLSDEDMLILKVQYNTDGETTTAVEAAALLNMPTHKFRYRQRAILERIRVWLEANGLGGMF